MEARFYPPTSTKALAEIISSHDVVLGVRLHACITAYAYDIPVVGLIWDDKSRCFSEQTGLQKNFVEPDDLDSGHVVDLIVKRLQDTGKDNDDIKQKLKQNTLQSFRKFLTP